MTETPEQNGVAELFKMTVVDMARCMLSEAKLSKFYWLQAVYMYEIV